MSAYHPSPEWIAWRGMFMQWLNDHPMPGNEEDTGVMARNFILIVEFVDGEMSPWLHHTTGDLSGGMVPQWIEDGMLRAALQNNKDRSAREDDE